ncbi:MAG: TonB-dependent receptor [Flavobacteriaceae bacterium]
MKKTNVSGHAKHHILKFDLKMKLTFLLSLVFLLQLKANTSYSQSTKLTLNLENVEVNDVIRKIESLSEFKFLYNRNDVDLKRRISIKAQNQRISRILSNLLKGTEIEFEVLNKQIVLRRKKDFGDVGNVIKTSNLDENQLSVSGTIVDNQGQPLPGANILEKGTTNGTQADFDGNFSISVANDSSILVISYIGFATKEVPTNGNIDIVVVLEESAAGLDEVVIVGYGTQKKSDLTGAVISVSEEDLQSRPVPSFQEAIQGRATGVNIRQNGGDLSGDFSIQIRGVGSVTGSNNPLIIVDGVPLFSGNLSTINPRDIASVNILKDASATAIYGARASNGVVIVTTKRGGEGKPVFTFSVETGFEQITKGFDVLTTEQQRQLFVAAFERSNRNTAVYDDPTNPIWQVDNDWQELGTRTALRRAYNFGVSGGSANSKYAISASVLDREGTIRNTDIKNWSLRANIDSKITEKFSVSGSIAGNHQIDNYVVNDQWGNFGYRSFAYNHSYTPAFDEDGNLDAVNTTASPFFGANNNPLINILLPTKERAITRILGSVKLDYEFLDGLTVSGNLGGDVLHRNIYEFNPIYEIGRFINEEGSIEQRADTEVNWVAEATLQYEKELEEHDLKVLLGVSAQQFTEDDFQVNGSGTVNNSLNQLNNQTDFTGEGKSVSSGLSSFFFRANYGFMDRYLATATVRRDGSSRFGPGNRFGIFPSGSVAWRISEESFLKNSNIVSNLKLRASYGLTGNQNIGDFAFITRTANRGYAFGNTAVIGNAPVNIGNPNLQWESAKQLDIGLNAGFFNNRISLEVDYYDKRSEDLLVAPPIPLTTGISQRPIVNLGSIRNTGIEFGISTQNLTGKLKWSTDFNITYNENEVLDIGTNSLGEPLELPGIEIPLAREPITLTREGYSVGSFYTYEFDGIWQLGEEAEAAAYYPGAGPGDPRYVDKNNNGIFDQGDRDFTGTNSLPKFFGGINNTFSYENFSINIFMNYATGYQVFNSARNLLARGVPFVQNLAEVADFWTPENPSNTVPRPSQGGPTTFLTTRSSTRFIENADFLRIKNLSLSYNLPEKVMRDIGFQSARFTLTGTNLFTFTEYTGLDPEANSNNTLLSSGIDFTPYPLTKLYSLTLEVSF